MVRLAVLIYQVIEVSYRGVVAVNNMSTGNYEVSLFFGKGASSSGKYLHHSQGTCINRQCEHFFCGMPDDPISTMDRTCEGRHLHDIASACIDEWAVNSTV